MTFPIYIIVLLYIDKRGFLFDRKTIQKTGLIVFFGISNGYVVRSEY